MSKLANLFGGGDGSSDNNDALRYSAPKEPKMKAQQAKSAISSSAPIVASVSPTFVATKATIEPGPSKVMASATVRLFRVNALTNSYEPHENSQPLGCVVIGSGQQFQFLVYNGQKVPQSVVALSAGFCFHVQGLYISYTDTHASQPSSWSALFDSYDVLNNVTRILTATIAHLCSLVDENNITALRPSGLIKTEYSSGDASINDEVPLASGMMTGISYTAWELGSLVDYPHEMLAMSPLACSNSDLIKIKIGPNANEFIPNLGELLLGCKKGSKVLFALSPRIAYAGSIMDLSHRKFVTSWLLVEVTIVKVKSATQEKAKKSPLPIDVEPVPVPVLDVKARMAQLAGPNAAVMLPTLLNNGNNNSNSNMSQANQYAQQQQQFSNNQNNNINNNNYSQQQQQQQEEVSGGNQYALTVVDGQESRSFYLGQHPHQQQSNQQPQQTHHHQHQQQQQQQQYQNQYNHNNPHQAQPIQQPQQQQQHPMGGMGYQSSYANTAAAAAVSAGPAQSYPFSVQQGGVGGGRDSMLLQSMQMSLIQLHGKVDQTNQHLLTSLGSIGTMNNNNNSRYFQVQPGNNNSSQGSMRVKTAELVAGLQAMVEEYERCESELKANLNNNLSSGLASEVKIKLEEKIELLQEKNERLMNEKANLLEKQATMLQLGSDSSSKVFALQQENDVLRRDKVTMQARIDELRDSLENASNSSSNRTTDERLRIIELENDLLMAKNQLSMKERQTSEEVNMWQSKLSTSNLQIEQLHLRLNSISIPVTAVVEPLNVETNSEVQEYLFEKLQALSDIHTSEVKTIQEKLFHAEKSLSTAQLGMKDLQAARENTLLQLQSANDRCNQLAAEISANNSNTSLSHEAIKNLMQNVYIRAGDVFNPVSDESGQAGSFSSEEVLKKLRTILKSVTATAQSS